MGDFLRELANNWFHASAMERVAFVVGLTGLSVFSGIAGSLLSLVQSRSYRRRAERLAIENERLETERDAALETVESAQAQARAWQPAAWLDAARRERDRGNEELAIAAIQEGMDRVRIDLARCALALAGYHLSLVVGPDVEDNLAEGTAFAQLATDLDPGDADAAFLLEEARMLSPEMLDLPDLLPGSFLPRGQEEAEAVIDAIIALASGMFAKGCYSLALRLYRRAGLITDRAGLTNTDLGLTVGYLTAEVALFAGRYEEVRDTLTALMPRQERAHGRDHPDTIATRILEVQALNALGDHAAAMDAISTLLPLQEGIGGQEHPQTLTIRHIKALVLNGLKRHQPALDDIGLLMPRFSRTFGPSGPQTLSLRQLEVQVLADLGESRRALDKAIALLPELEHVNGPDHPDTLKVRYLKAAALDELGDHHVSLSELDALSPSFDAVLGKNHPDTLTVWHCKAVVLNNLRRYGDAIILMTDIAAKNKGVLGEHHPNYLFSLRSLAEFFLAAGDADKALQQLAIIMPQQDEADRDISAIIEAEALVALGERERAAIILDGLMPRLRQRMAPTHVRLVQAMEVRRRLQRTAADHSPS